MTRQTAHRLLLAAALAFGIPAAAAAQLVANSGQTAASGNLTVGGSSNWSNALVFTTGGNSLGYTLSAVDVVLAAGTPATATRVSIYSTSGSPAAPNSSLHVLNNPTTLTASATNTFTANAGATLAANTTYAVVVDRSSGSGSTTLAKTTSNAEDSGAASGWSIGDIRHFRQGTSGSWSQATDAEKPLIAIKGILVGTVTANPTTIAAGRDTAVTFSFSNFTAGASFTLGVGSGCTALSFPSTNAAVTIASDGTGSATRTLTGASVASATDCAITLSPAVTGATLPTITVEELPLVSNSGQTQATGVLFYGWDGVKALDRALAFTTGSSPLGYTLSAVDVKLASGTPSTNTRVSIYSTRSNPPIPETSLHVLNNPSPLVASATNTFTAPSGVTLDANTTYAVVIEIPSGTDSTDLHRTVSNAEDSGAASGWTIADNAATRNRALGTWTVSLTDFNKPFIAIKGTAVPLPPVLVSNTGQTDSDTISVGLNFDRHVGQAFTTGGNSAGYTLSLVDVKLGSTRHANTQVSIYTTSSDGRPGDSLHVLTNPSSLTAGFNTFVAGSGVTLAANTTYAVVINIDLETLLVSDDTVLRLTSSASEDANPASGWSIADEAYLRDYVGSNANLGWREVSSKLKPLIAIRATAKTLVTAPPASPSPSPDPAPPASTCTLVAPYWSGPTGGFTVSPAPGRSSVSLTCGGRTTEYMAENGLVTRLVRSTCRRTGLQLEGAAPGGWYWQHGDRNAAAAPLVCSETLGGPGAVVSGGVTADVRDDGTLFRHDTARLIGIVPHLKGNECSEYVTPYWQGDGGVVVRPAEGRETVRVRVQCGRTWSTMTPSAGEDGVVAELVSKSYCTDDEGKPKQGRLTVTGAAPGGWYWISGERNAAVAPLMCADLLGGPVAVDPGAMTSRATEDGTYFKQDTSRLIGVVPHLSPKTDEE